MFGIINRMGSFVLVYVEFSREKFIDFYPLIFQVLKQHINRVRNMLKSVLNVAKFINDCFQWENPLLSFCAFIVSRRSSREKRFNPFFCLDITGHCVEFSIVYVTLCTFVHICMECCDRIPFRYFGKTICDIGR